jgi:hypothetical protein
MKPLNVAIALCLSIQTGSALAQVSVPGGQQVQQAAQTPSNPPTAGSLVGGGPSAMLNQFEDMSINMNANWNTPTFGAGAWGDFNGDGWPDLWQSNHAKFPTLMQNNGDGTFTDVTTTIANIIGPVDSHGCAWADFDGDGDLDLIELVGADSGQGECPNQLWRNDNGYLNEVAAAYGLDYPTGRGRTPLWLDWNNDGRLDLVTANFASLQSEDKVFTQQPNGTFLEEPPSTGFIPSGKPTHFAQLADFDADGKMEVHMNGLSFPSSIYSLTPTSWTDITNTFGFEALPNVVDSAPGDFDGDLMSDFYFARDPFWRLSQADLDKNGTLRVDLLSDLNEVGFTFRCDGPIQISISTTSDLNSFFLGESGVKPTATDFVLSHKDDISGGVFVRAADDPGTYIGREWDSNTWILTMYSPTRARLEMTVKSLTPIEQIAPFGFSHYEPGSDLIMDHSSTGWENYSLGAIDINGSSVVTGDFDNDMDLDLYVVRTGRSVNLGNKLYENLGGGQFAYVDSAGGANGVLTGVGDSVSMVDYDQDGFLDLFLTNGRSGALLSESGRHQLFHNTGNSNHWLEIDLVGTTSNVHGIGARVLAISGGVTQMRSQGGGIHRWTQNHSRLHFGLGANTTVDTLEIHWPSGIVQTMSQVSADQVITVIEQ